MRPTRRSPATAQSPFFFRVFASVAPSAGLAHTSYSYPHVPLRPFPPPQADSSVAYSVKLEAELQSLPMLVSHRSRPDASEWYETRPHQNMSEDQRMNSLTAGALRGSGKLASVPLTRVKRDESESLTFIHVGRSVCGHDGIVHGGLLATLLDEGMGRTAINNLPGRIGFTANLSLNYLAPTKADQFIVLTTKLTDLQGRKVWVEGIVQDTNGVVLAESKTMWIQPKYAELMNKSSVNQLMGERGTQPKAWLGNLSA